MRPVTGMAAALALALPALSPALAEPAAQPAAQDPSNVPEAGDPEARRRMLNAGQAAAARDQLAANAASQARHDTAVALDRMEQDRNAAAYGDALAQHDMAEQSYRASRDQWEVKNPACWKGDAIECPADPEATAN